MSEQLNKLPIIELDDTENTAPRYDLSAEELGQLNTEMVLMAEDVIGDEGILALWINPYSKYANFVRTHEASYFPEVKELAEDTEDETLFLTLVDTRLSQRRVVHAATVTGFSNGSSTAEGLTPFNVINELIDKGNFSPDDFKHFYESKGVDLNSSIAVETNFRIGEKSASLYGISAAGLTYTAIFKMLEHKDAQLGRAVVFATINKPQLSSFKKVGLEYEPLMGRTDLDTPESDLGVDSMPVTIAYDQHSYDLLKPLCELVPDAIIT